MKRKEIYERSQALKRIQEETERARELVAQRAQLQVSCWNQQCPGIAHEVPASLRMAWASFQHAMLRLTMCPLPICWQSKRFNNLAVRLQCLKSLESVSNNASWALILPWLQWNLTLLLGWFAVQDQRRIANMDASFQRQKIMQAMDKLQSSKNWDSLSQGGGVSIDSLLS